jgi:hypothetical protein
MLHATHVIIHPSVNQPASQPVNRSIHILHQGMKKKILIKSIGY